MANPSSGSGEKEAYRTFRGVGRQFSNSSPAEVKQQKSFWSIVAKKANYMLLEDKCKTFWSDKGGNNNQISQDIQARSFTESKQQHGDKSIFQRRLSALTTSLSTLGGGISNAIEESLNKMEAKASDFMLSRRGLDYVEDETAGFRHESPGMVAKSSRDEDFSIKSPQQQNINPLRHLHHLEETAEANSHEQTGSVFKSSHHQNSIAKPKAKEDSYLRPLQDLDSGHSAADKETQLKASRDVAMAMAAKAKLLLCELKEAKADLALANERCAKLEEENHRIRASISNDPKLDEEDLVRVQLETLLAEKARLVQENAYFARENQFLQEMIEFHRLTIQTGANNREESMPDIAEKSPDNQLHRQNKSPPETIIATITD